MPTSVDKLITSLAELPWRDAMLKEKIMQVWKGEEGKPVSDTCQCRQQYGASQSWRSRFPHLRAVGGDDQDVRPVGIPGGGTPPSDAPAVA